MGEPSCTRPRTSTCWSCAQATRTSLGRNPVESLIAFLWDIGLEVGHSVRTVSECVEEAAKDVTVATNLMEARLVCGEIVIVR